MKKYQFLLLALAALVSAACGPKYANKAEKVVAELHNPNSKSVVVVAHRGDWRYAPENSIAAIEHSIAIGVDVVEIDLQLTRDSVLILMHDGTLNRTTTGKGSIRDWPLDSIKTLQLKSGCGIKTKETVPTLEEALLAAKGKVLRHAKVVVSAGKSEEKENNDTKE